MDKKSYVKVSGYLFLLIAGVHLLRVLLGWEAEVGGWEVPMWLSMLAVAVAGYLGYSAYKMKK